MLQGISSSTPGLARTHVYAQNTVGTLHSYGWTCVKPFTCIAQNYGLFLSPSLSLATRAINEQRVAKSAEEALRPSKYALIICVRKCTTAIIAFVPCALIGSQQE